MIWRNERVWRRTERAGFDEVYGGRFVSYVKRIDDLPVTYWSEA